MDNRLTCDGDWDSSVPGYTYWKGRRFEHLGYGGHGSWIQAYPTWIKDTVKKMEHYEELEVDIAVGYYHDHWFCDLKKGDDVAYFEYLKENWCDFYLRGEDDIAFPIETKVLDNEETKHAWESFYDLFIWNRKTYQWTIEKHHCISPDVVYNDLNKKGWNFGTLFWGGYSRPKPGGGWEQHPPYSLWQISREEFQRCFTYYKLPQSLPSQKGG